MTIAVTGTAHLADGAMAYGSISGPVYSPDGTKVAFFFAKNPFYLGPVVVPDTGLYVEDLATHAVTLASANGAGTAVPYGADYAFSPDGGRLVFTSSGNVVVKDLSAGTLTTVSATSGGQAGNATDDMGRFSPDGTEVLFWSNSSNLPGNSPAYQSFYLKNLATGDVSLVAQVQPSAGFSNVPVPGVFSSDGTRIAYTGMPQTSGGSYHPDIFIKNLVTGVTEDITAPGYTTVSGVTALYASRAPVFSPDGTKVAFVSNDPHFMPGAPLFGSTQSNLYVKDLATGVVTLASADAAGNAANAAVLNDAVFSPDGRYIAFESDASNLVPGDHDSSSTFIGDLFVKDLVTGDIIVVGDGGRSPVFSPDGTRLAYYTGIDGPGVIKSTYIAMLNTKPVVLGTNAGERLYGTAGDDYVYGLEGNDRLDGKGDSDTLLGGNGDDSYIVSDAGDRVIEAVGGGTDKVYATVDFTLGANIENLTLQGTGAISGAGNDLANVINGNEAANGLSGGGGVDHLHANGGDDTLNGGAGADALYGDAGADTFVFDSTAYAGRDTIKDFSLADGDRIELQGLLAGYTPGTSKITDFVRITESAGNSYLYVDASGAKGWANFVQVARLDGVTCMTDETALAASGALIVA